MANKQRNTAFDIAKAIAMYLVVLGHLIADRTTDPAYFVNMLHLPVLFFISGFFSQSSIEKRTAGDLLRRKAVTLLVPYVIWSFISLIANTALSVLQGTFSLGGVLAEAVQIFLYARSVWFLIQLFVTFAVFLAVYKLAARLGASKFFPAIAIVSWLVISALIPGWLLDFAKFKWLFPFFLAGYLIAKHREGLAHYLRMHKWAVHLSWLSVLYPVLIAAMVHFGLYPQYAATTASSVGALLTNLAYYAISTAGIVLVMCISRCLSKLRLGQILAQIGTYSMDIYVIHMFLIKFIPIPIDVNRVNPIFAISLLAAITLVIVLTIWLLSKYVLRRIKLFRISVGMN